MPHVAPRPPLLRFGVFEVDLRTGELRKQGLKIKLQEQPFQILALLLERPGQIVSREEIQRKLWSVDTFVDFEHSLATAVKKLREALGDTADNPRFVETLPRRGYRFIYPVEPVAPLSKAEGLGRRRGGRWVVAVTGGAVLAVGAILLAFNAAGLRNRLFRATPPPPKIESIAVLPLENLSGDPEQEYFADGMTDALITGLGKVGALRVISRTSAMHYKGTKKRLPEIARELRVDAIVEGTVQRSGDRIRITAQLLHAPTDRHLWAESYERDLRDVLALQGEMAQAIAREVRINLTPQEQTRLAIARPVDPKAHEAYLKGWYFSNQRTREGTQKGLQYAQQTVEIDPTYAPGYALLANCYYESGEYRRGDLAWAEAIEKTRAAAVKALELDDSLADPHIELGALHEAYDWDWAGSEREFKRAIELEPNNTRAHVAYAWHFAFLGRYDEAIQEAKRALQLDPVGFLSNNAIVCMYLWARQNDQAIEYIQKWLEISPNHPWPYIYLGNALQRKGMNDEAVVYWQKAMKLQGASAEDVAAVGHAYKTRGIKGVWRLTLGRLKQRRAREGAEEAVIAVYCSLLGEKDETFEWLEKGYQLRNEAIIYIKGDPHFDNIRSDPRFQDLLRRMNFPE